MLPLLFLLEWLAHWPLLHLPYYWDEAGYYIPAAFDFYRTGSLTPYSTLSNAHPPLPSLYLAACWRLFGFSPFVTRSAMCLVAALALLAVYRLGLYATASRAAAAATVLLTALYPVWFAQSSLAHADLFAAAGTLWGLALLVTAGDEPAGTRRYLTAVACFALAALAKEIAVGTPLALALYELWLTARGAPERPGFPKRMRLQRAGLLALPTLPLALWFTYHRHKTGFLFGNPEYLRYNATSTLTPLRILVAFGHRVLHITAHLNMFVPVIIALGCLVLPALAGRPALAPRLRDRLMVVIAANLVFFSVLGGALLTRYLLPCYPLVLLLCVAAWQRRLRHWYWLATLSMGAFVAGLFFNPPYRFAPEDTLAYRDSIVLQQEAIAQIEARYGSPTVLTAWPASDELTKPELGYLSAPMPVIAIDNFSFGQIRAEQQRASTADSVPYTVALLFSTKYDPPRLPFSLGRANQALDERFFAFHHDLPPEVVAKLLGGQVVWRDERNGQWAAVLYFERTQPGTMTTARVALP